ERLEVVGHGHGFEGAGAGATGIAGGHPDDGSGQRRGHAQELAGQLAQVAALPADARHARMRARMRPGVAPADDARALQVAEGRARVAAAAGLTGGGHPGARSLALVGPEPHPTAPSSEISSRRLASTANSIGSSLNTSRQKPSTIMDTASSSPMPRERQ